MKKVVKQSEKDLEEKYGFHGTYDEAANETPEAITLLQVPESEATYPQIPETSAVDNTPKIGDIAFVYWHGHGWFPAKIENWFPIELSYMIRWTDGNWAPEKAKYNNLCVDKIPDPATIGVGSKVLFKQGLYYCGYNADGSVCDSSGRTLSEKKKQELRDKNQITDRWHMGIIRKVVKNASGDIVYNGEHIADDDPQASRSNYVGYSRTFEGLPIDQLRTLPNILKCLDSSGNNNNDVSCDVFVSKASQDDQSVKRILQCIRNTFSVTESKSQGSAHGLQQTVSKIKSCKVFLVCLSDNFIAEEQLMSELLYAKKTLGKTVIPLVIGTSQKWTQSTAGMILAGQLYIQFATDDMYSEKICELQKNLEKLIISPTTNYISQKTDSGDGQPRVFLSYCWTNSKSSFDAEQVKCFSGHMFSDPRKIKADLEKKIGETIWLDIEQLDSVDDSGMYGQIAAGLTACSVVIMCVSMEYSKSQNCQMEANFALRSLKKMAIMLEVGSGKEEDRQKWTQSSVGMILPTNQKPYIMTPDQINGFHQYEAMLQTICQNLQDILFSISRPASISETENESSLNASIPMIGGAVMAHYAAWQFYPAKVARFDKLSMNYTVNWDDPDPSYRVQPYNLVAVNRTPNENEIGIGTSVLFKQGRYKFGNSTGDVWNLGEITRIENVNGVKLYSGKHSKTANDGLAVASLPMFSPTFDRLKCQDIRLFPNAFELLQVYGNLQLTNGSRGYEAIQEEICQNVQEILPSVRRRDPLIETKNKSSLSASIPMIGGAVIAHYTAWLFFPAKVAIFDKFSMNYTVDWEYTGQSYRVQPYNLVVVNRTPNENEIGIGTSVLFKQGRYKFGNSTGDVWNLGEITRIENVNGVKLYSGKHSKTANDGLAVASLPMFSPNFDGLKFQDIRLFPNAFELLQIYRNLQLTNGSLRYEAIQEGICQNVQEILPSVRRRDSLIEAKSKSSVSASMPMIGEAVLAHYTAWQFYAAKVAMFDKFSMTYTVDWDDTDPSYRVQPYNLVVVNRTPNENEIGIGTSVLFKKGIYEFGNSIGYVWNLGEITRIENVNGVKLFSGKHLKTANDGLPVASPIPKPIFERAKCEDIRLFPNAIELLQVYRNL